MTHRRRPPFSLSLRGRRYTVVVAYITNGFSITVGTYLPPTHLPRRYSRRQIKHREKKKKKKFSELRGENGRKNIFFFFHFFFPLFNGIKYSYAKLHALRYLLYQDYGFYSSVLICIYIYMNRWIMPTDLPGVKRWKIWRFSKNFGHCNSSSYFGLCPLQKLFGNIPEWFLVARKSRKL